MGQEEVLRGTPSTTIDTRTSVQDIVPHTLASGVKYCPPKDEVFVFHLQLKKQTNKRQKFFSNDRYDVLLSDKLEPILSSKYRLINFIYRLLKCVILVPEYIT